MSAADTGRPVRLCDTCGQVDDHPRHVYGTTNGEAQTSPEVMAAALKTAAGDEALTADLIRQVQDTATRVKHLDCCAADGCPDGSCDAALASAGGATGAKLVKHLTGGGVDTIGTDLNEQRTAAAQAANDQLPQNVTPVDTSKEV